MKVALQSLADRGIEWFSSLVMVAWGATLSLPGDILDHPGYVAFRRFGLSEEFWTGVFLSVGFARLVALYINGRWPRSPHIRIAGSLFGAISWAQVSFMLYDGSQINNVPLNTGCAVYALLAAFELFAVNRAAFDARYYTP